MTIAPETDHPAVTAARAARAALDSREAEISRLLVERYARVLRDIEPLITSLIDEYEIALASGEEFTKGQITRLRRYTRLQEQLLDEMDTYGAFAADLIATSVDNAIQAASSDALNIVAANFPSPSAAAAVSSIWNRLPVEAIENAIGITDVIGERYRQFYSPVKTAEFMDAIVDAMIKGQNPRITAKQGAAILRQRAFSAGSRPLTDAMRQSRTAQIWAWREATRANYLANQRIVSGWTWAATMDDHTCLSCLANHGKEFPLTETLNDHHNGRCVMLPNVPGAEALGIRPVPLQSGEDIFNALPRDEQIRRMGKGRFEAYQAGKFKFDQLTSEYDDEVYGKMRRETPLKELTAP
jgi:hypothetical protein